jgi:hypothetical protein
MDVNTFQGTPAMEVQYVEYRERETFQNDIKGSIDPLFRVIDTTDLMFRCQTMRVGGAALESGVSPELPLIQRSMVTIGLLNSRPRLFIDRLW